ncbi:MAG: hypothetical protein ABSA79_03930 [Candidatus Bathyarchaeia archaeon]
MTKIVYSSPTVVNGAEYFGSYDHNFCAVGQASGSRSWNTGIPTIAYYIIPKVAFGCNNHCCSYNA